MNKTEQSSPLWVVPPEPDPALVQNLCGETSLPPLVIKLLLQRGYKTKEAMRAFLRPKLEDLENPFLLPDMAQAVERIQRAVENQERILIYGDYDVDGVTSTALFWYLFKHLGANASFYIPHREREGYGLSDTGIWQAKEDKINLIIAVDCGTTAYEEINLANHLGIDVIVCDHHEPKTSATQSDGLPPACAVVNPKRKDSQYPFTDLAGVGLSFKLAWAILSQLGKFPVFLQEHLDLVALGTIADVVSLTGENRILAKFGMNQLARTTKPGLRALLKITGLENKEISTYHIGFILGPRLNASGRLSEAEKAVRLLITEDAAEGQELAQDLDSENRLRQNIEEGILKEASALVEREDWRKKRVLVLANANWHEGVVGIVASRLVDRFNRPAILVALKENRCKGSGRSIPGFHLYDALKACEDHLISFGGHKYAAGVLVSRDELKSFEQKINAYAFEHFPDDLFQKRLFVDGVASLSEIDERLLQALKWFEPFGQDNPTPVFSSRGLEVVGYPRTVGKGRDHLKFRVREHDTVLSAIAFGMGEKLLNLEVGKKEHIDIAYQFDENTYTGKPRMELTIKDLKIRGLKTNVPNDSATRSVR
jgi:single-stranded-DNA-specific exonuclease